MSEKTVLIIVKSIPFSQLNYFEALRVATGLQGEHQVSLLWMGDGIYSAVIKADTTLTIKFLEQFEDLEVNLFIEKEALNVRGIQQKDVIPQAKVVDREEISKLVAETEVSLLF
jgi:sulfur relay (sulfurtransferase) DsrF/TusC family protein